MMYLAVPAGTFHESRLLGRCCDSDSQQQHHPGVRALAEVSERARGVTNLGPSPGDPPRETPPRRIRGLGRGGWGVHGGRLAKVVDVTEIGDGCEVTIRYADDGEESGWLLPDGVPAAAPA